MEGSAQIVLSSLEQHDRELTLLVNSWHTAFTDHIWVFFSNKVVWVVLYALVLYFLFKYLGWKRALLAVVCLVLTFVCCDQTANLVKNSVCRLRPSHDPWMLANGLHLPHGTGGRFGFFSAHAANCFGFAICSLKIFRTDSRRSFRGYGYAIMAWAFLVSLSRVFLGRHFFGDIAVGAFVGLAFGCLAAAAYRRFSARF